MRPNLNELNKIESKPFLHLTLSFEITNHRYWDLTIKEIVKNTIKTHHLLVNIHLSTKQLASKNHNIMSTNPHQVLSKYEVWRNSMHELLKQSGHEIYNRKNIFQKQSKSFSCYTKIRKKKHSKSRKFSQFQYVLCLCVVKSKNNSVKFEILFQ